MDKTLWIMCGAPGSGKTWTAKNILMKGLGWRYISRDEIRYSIIRDDEEYFSHEDEVFNVFVKKIKTALNEEGIFNVIADATHLNWSSRRKLLTALGQDKKKTCDIIPVVLQTSIERTIEQNEKREGRACVPRSVLRRMSLSMTDPKDDGFEYAAIMYLNYNDIQGYISKP